MIVSTTLIAMNDTEFLRYLPRCAQCGEILPAGAGPLSVAVLRVHNREYEFHAQHAPQGCKGGYVTIIQQGVINSAVLAKWDRNMEGG
jgi:hypothetical protein